MPKAKWAAGVAALACIGAFPAYGFMSRADDRVGTITTLPTTAAPSENTATSGGPSPAPAAIPSTPVPTDSSKPAPTHRASTRPRKPAPVTPPLFSGLRTVVMGRVQSFEGAVSLLDDRLTEVDDDRGRILFVLTPLGADKYLIKSYDAPGIPDEPGPPGVPICWQVHHPHTTASLTVEGAACNAKNKDQQFTITALGKKQYAISHQGAFLQYFPTSGFILEELGDATLGTTFRIPDRGPAPNPNG